MYTITDNYKKMHKTNDKAYPNYVLLSDCETPKIPQKYKFRHYLFIVLFSSLLITYLMYANSIRKIAQRVYSDSQCALSVPKTQTGADLTCYKLPQIDEEVPVMPGYEVQPNSIFFAETSCRHGGKLNFTKRQACAYESAARTHPSSEVLVLFPSPISLRDPPLLVSKLLQYPNIKLVHVDLERYFGDTPLENFDIRVRLAESSWPLSHSSDVLRLLTLWKYGGTFLDSDFVVFRPLNEMENYAGLDYCGSITNAAMNVNIDGSGSLIIAEMLSDLRDTFRGDGCFHNGPFLLPRVLRKICNESDVLRMTPEKCNGFTVFPPPPRSPFIPTYSFEMLVEERASQAIMDTMLESMMGIHLVNSQIDHIPVKVGSEVAYDVLAAQFCPEVYSTFGDHF